MEGITSNIENLSLEGSNALLTKFIQQNETSPSLPQFEDRDREKFWDSIFRNLDGEESLQLLCLKAIRILSREKSNLTAYIDDERLRKLLDISLILTNAEGNNECSVEALKCLCNITFNLPNTAESLNNLEVTLNIVERLSRFTGRRDLINRKLFEIKLLFLITALCIPARQNVYDKYSVKFFTDLCLKDFSIPEENLVTPKKSKIDLTVDEAKVLSEILKAVFNVLCSMKSGDTEKGSELAKFCTMCRELILLGRNPLTDVFLRDIVNVLTLIPSGLLDALILPGHKWSEKNVETSPSMEAVSVLIDFLDSFLVKIEAGTPKDELSPIILLLTNMAKSNKKYRRYIRARVLPSLKEVHTRPEVGSSLRNKLCRLLTCPLTSTRDLVADFLFILCKKSVSRMVKYTGYGNAAGLFANRGLLGGDPVPHFSSEDEDSETEEYSQNKELINPVVGCVTPPRTDPLREMTEEQKEFLAMELVNKIDQLQKEGIITPCRVGPDGKPQPVQHVLQLQEEDALPTRKKQI